MDDALTTACLCPRCGLPPCDGPQRRRAMANLREAAQMALDGVNDSIQHNEISEAEWDGIRRALAEAITGIDACVGRRTTP